MAGVDEEKRGVDEALHKIGCVNDLNQMVTA